MMEMQSLINLAGGAAIGVAGWFARQLWDAVGSLRDDIHKIEVDLPRHYVRKDEFHDGIREIKDMLGKIFDRLDAKVDK